MKFEAILFDCDGVLVDSEPITNGVLRDLLAESGWSLSPEECMRVFVGKAVRDERVLIADYPIRKNGECPHFYTFLHNKCNFLTGRCWVLTPFLEVGARAFGITFA